jgi:hypothetical protein
MENSKAAWMPYLNLEHIYVQNEFSVFDLFLAYLVTKFPNVCKILFAKIEKGTKGNEECYADFKSVEKVPKKTNGKKLRAKALINSNIKV